MKFFIDTAKLDEIREAHSLGLVDGVTTNPSLCAKIGTGTKEQFKEHIRTICELVQGPISGEVVATEAGAMVVETRELAQIHEWVANNVPMIEDGFNATRILAAEGIKVNVTLIFQPLQPLLAAKAGTVLSVPLSANINHRGMEIVEQIVTIFENYGFDTEIIVASVRHPLHVLEGALAGADIPTVPYGVLMQLINHPLTGTGQQKFSQNSERSCTS